jgi:hypothetical protein
VAYQGDCDAVIVGEGLVGVLYTAAEAGQRPAAVLLHGIPGAEKNFDIASRLRDVGWHALVLHFAGTWGSAGNYDMTAQPDDARAAIDFLLRGGVHWQVNANRIALIGYSLGSRAALVCANRDPRVRYVVSIGGIADFDDLLLSDEFFAAVSPFLHGVDAAGLKQQWARLGGAENPLSLIARNPQPTLIVHGTADETVPHYMAEVLRREGGDKTTLFSIPDANHVFSRQRLELVALVTGWLTNTQ